MAESLKINLFLPLCFQSIKVNVSYYYICRQNFKVMNLNAVETCLVMAGRQLTNIVGNRENKFHPGTTELNVLANVSKVNVDDLVKVPTSIKIDMLGEARVKDSSRSTGSTGRREDGHESEPMSWDCFSSEFMSELLHRFRPKAVTLYCASDPIEVLAMMENKIPVIAYCSMIQLISFFFKSFNFMVDWTWIRGQKT